MNITLSNNVLDELDTSRIEHVHPTMQQWFHLRSGKEHYRLLLYLTTQYFNGIKIADIGTYRGASALALAQNPKNKVFSVDLVEHAGIVPKDNITFCVGNLYTDSAIQNNILDSYFIFMDIDHMYTGEMWIYKLLTENNWKGILICDDINLNNNMRKFWKEVSLPKIDVTKYGHATGTGIINFTNDLTFNLK